MSHGNKERLHSYKIIFEKSKIDHSNAVNEYKVSIVNYDIALEKYVAVENRLLDGKKRIGSIFNSGSVLDVNSYERLVFYCNALLDEKNSVSLEVNRMDEIRSSAKNNLIYFSNYLKNVERIIDEISDEIEIESNRKLDMDLNDIYLITRFGA